MRFFCWLFLKSIRFFFFFFKFFISSIKFKFFELEVVVFFKFILKVFLILIKETFLQFKFLVDIIACDFPKKKMRFCVRYLLLSLRFNVRLQIITKFFETQPIFSVCYLFNSSVWLERELWDLYGIFFLGNIALRRILTDYGFLGHPLRKDFPLSGFIEV